MQFNTKALLLILTIVSTFASGTADAVAQLPEVETEEPASQVTSDNAPIPSWVEADPFTAGDDDPLGIDLADGMQGVTPTSLAEQSYTPIPVRRGPVLRAIAGVREVEHRVSINIVEGLALVQHEMSFVSRARTAAEVQYRLAAPPEATLVSLRVEDDRGSREGSVDAFEGILGPYDDAARTISENADALPIAHAAPLADQRGNAFLIRAAPVLPNSALENDGARPGALKVRITYLVPTQLHDDQTRLLLVPQGRDDRVVSHRTLSTGELALMQEIGADHRVQIRWPADGGNAPHSLVGTLWRFDCGDSTCLRARLRAPRVTPRPRDVVLLMDASPSCQQQCRGRQNLVLSTLLESLHPNSRVRIIAFASRARALVDMPRRPGQIDVDQVSEDLFDTRLGGATRFETAWELSRPWVSRPSSLIVLIGDGGLTLSAAARTSVAEAARQAQLVSLNIADRPNSLQLQQAWGRNAQLLEFGNEDSWMLTGGGSGAFANVISGALAPIVRRDVRLRIGAEVVHLGTLRAGEAVSWEGLTQTGAHVSWIGSTQINRGGRRPNAPPADLVAALGDRIQRRASGDGQISVVGGRRLVALAEGPPPRTCRTRGVFHSPSPPVPRGTRLALAHSRRCNVAPEVAPPAAEPRSTSLPARTLLQMLRQRIIPPARDCLRSDRAGRSRYRTRATFRFVLADREVVEAELEGRLSATLSQCLLATIDNLEIPAFEGTISVNYPIHTEMEQAPPTLRLDRDVASIVDAVGDSTGDRDDLTQDPGPASGQGQPGG